MGKTDKFWVFLFFLYSFCHLLFRVSMGAGLDLDEAQAIIQAQELRLGYGAQPPVYFWVQHLLFQLFGSTVFALSIFKNTLLLLSSLAVYALFRSRFSPLHAGLSALGLILIPELSFETQRALTHTNMAIAASALTTLFVWRCLHKASMLKAGLFGALLAWGTFSKFNFMILGLGLIFAIISNPKWRSTFKPSYWAASLISFLTLSTAPLLWIFMNPEAISNNAHKFKMQNDVPIWKATFVSISEFFGAVLGMPLLALLILAPFWFFNRKTYPPLKLNDLQKFLIHSMGFALVLVFIGAVATQSATLSQRWLSPILFALAPLLVSLIILPLSQRAQKIYLGLVGLCVFSIFAGLYYTHFYGSEKSPSLRSAPYGALANWIGEPEGRAIRTGNMNLAGNLKILRPDWNIHPLDPIYGDPKDGDILLFSREDRAHLWGDHIETFSAPHLTRQNSLFAYYRIDYSAQKGTQSE